MFTVSTPGFLSFGTFERGFLERSLVLGVRVGFGGRKGALASALIYTSRFVLLNCFVLINCFYYCFQEIS